MNEKIPNPKEIEKEISEFLSKKFGDSVKIVSPIVMPQEAISEKVKEPLSTHKKIHFHRIHVVKHKNNQRYQTYYYKGNVGNASNPYGGLYRPAH